MNIPMPNERLNDKTVVASTWLNDDAGTEMCLVLCLEAAPPFFAVAQLEWQTWTGGGGWVASEWEMHHNIVPAVACYEEMGGDY